MIQLEIALKMMFMLLQFSAMCFVFVFVISAILMIIKATIQTLRKK